MEKTILINKDLIKLASNIMMQEKLNPPKSKKMKEEFANRILKLIM